MNHCKYCGKKTIFSDCCSACQHKKLNTYECRLCGEAIPSYGLCEKCKNKVYEEIRAVKEQEEAEWKKEKEREEIELQKKWRAEEERFRKMIIEDAIPEREKEKEMRSEIENTYSIHYFSYEQVKTQLKELARKLFGYYPNTDGRLLGQIEEYENQEPDEKGENQWIYRLSVDEAGYYHTEEYHIEAKVELSKNEIKEEGVYQYCEPYRSEDYLTLMQFDEYLKHYISLDIFQIKQVQAYWNDGYGTRCQYRVKLSTSDDPNGILYANVTHINVKYD